MANLAVSASLFLILSFTACQHLSHAQENAQRQIPPSLIECYNSSYFMNRDNRLPSNIDTLITLIEKVENSNEGFDMSLRNLASSLLHRFRQDGIQRAPGINPSPGVLPYSPTGYQFTKFRILLSRLIPTVDTPFPNNSLSREERCSLHFMLSSSFNKQTRGDESQVCYRLSDEYSSQRLARDVTNEQHQEQQQRLRKNSFTANTEPIARFSESLEHKNNRRRSRAASQFRRGPHSFDDAEYWYEGNNYNPSGNSLSSCPAENGVIWTPWGTVNAGTLIAGIAAGLQKQQVQLRALLALARREGNGVPQAATVAVDNRWAATLAGDLAEVALLQVPSNVNREANVGASGGWNSTVMPKWYFVKQSQNLEMTDAEIRGGLDGLILGLNIEEWHRQASSMRLSQLLRMYYSMEGVLDSGIKACNRKEQFQKLSPLNDLIVQTSAFAQVLDREMQMDFTLSPQVIAEFSTISANALMAYIPQYLNDVPCFFRNAQSQDISESIITMTNIYIYLDTSWQYNDIVNYLNHILQHLNIHPYASSITLLSAFDASIIVDHTHHLTDVYNNWNVTTHSQYTSGFNLPTILNSIQNLTQNYMNEEKRISSVGGRSLVALLVPNVATIGDVDSSYSISSLQYINEQIPDLRFLFFGAGNMDRFSAFVRDSAQDLFPLNFGSDVKAACEPVIKRIRKIPRRLINPRCGSSWQANTWGSDQMTQYVSPGRINFYRLSSNYFYRSGSSRYVNIRNQNSNLKLNICSSRYATSIMQNSSIAPINSDQKCSQTSGSAYSYDISSACEEYNTIHECPPLYLSVEGPPLDNIGAISSELCIDSACQTPIQIPYTISVVSLDCTSGAPELISSITLIIMTYLLHPWFI